MLVFNVTFCKLSIIYEIVRVQWLLEKSNFLLDKYSFKNFASYDILNPLLVVWLLMWLSILNISLSGLWRWVFLLQLGLAYRFWCKRILKSCFHLYFYFTKVCIIAKNVYDTVCIINYINGFVRFFVKFAINYINLFVDVFVRFICVFVLMF